MAEVHRIISQLPVSDLGEGPPQIPLVATVREIDVEVINNQISFFFSKGTFLEDLSTYPGGLDQLLRDIRARNYTYKNSTSNRPDPPETPLSLNNEHLAYVIYSLSAKNWQFCSNYPPFTISMELKATDVYFEARRISPEPGLDKQKVSLAPSNPHVDDCTVAYFIADGRKAKGFTGQYIHAINIHVDLIHKEAHKARVPIIIDPDVRHPGGSGEV